MSPNEIGLPLIVILGPTAVGKTEVAIKIAKRTNGEIVSADSRLFYRGMDIGTAKPTLIERNFVTHHLIDVAEPDEAWSLARFQEAAYKTIDDIHLRGKLPYLVGGTGQYIRAITEGWVIPKQEPDPRLRNALETWASEVGPHGLHDRLGVLDPMAAKNIDPRNVRRTVRALEVIFHTGKMFSKQQNRGIKRYRSFQLGLSRPREELYHRIDTRIDYMFSAGWIEEVKGLLDSGVNPEIASLSAIGYPEIIAHLRGGLTLEETITLIKRKTRQFVRRQANWFKVDDPEIQWFQMNQCIVDQLEAKVHEFLREI